MFKKNFKRKEQAEPAGGSDPGKKFAKPNEDDGIVVCELPKNKRVTVKNFSGKVIVDIREFYTKDGQVYPGKKGIALSLDQWEVLMEHIEEIDELMS